MLRVPAGQCSSDMKVDVRNGLMSGEPVVLPDRDARPTKRLVNGSSCSDYRAHQSGCLGWNQVKDRLTMLYGYNEDMSLATLLTSHENRSFSVTPKHRERFPPSQVVAKGATFGLRYVDVAAAHEGLSDAKNDLISSMSSFPTSCFRTTMSSRSQTRSARDANMNDIAVSRIAS